MREQTGRVYVPFLMNKFDEQIFFFNSVFFVQKVFFYFPELFLGYKEPAIGDNS